MSHLILPKEVDSKFRFITVAAQRAKQLQNGRQAARGGAQPQAHPRGHAGSPGGRRLLGAQGRRRRRRRAAEASSARAAPVVLGVTGCIGAYKACEVLRELQKRERGRARGDDGARHALRLRDDVRGALAPPGLRRPVRAGRRRATSATSAWPTPPTCCWWRPPPPTPSASSRAASPTTRCRTLYLATHGAGAGGAGHERQHVRAPGGGGEPRHRCARAGVGVVEPGSGYLACGWLGKGRLAEVPEIVEAALAVLARAPRPGGRDACWSPPAPPSRTSTPCASSRTAPAGRMGYRLAEAARDRGARVVLVSGPTALPAAGRRRARRACARRRRWRRAVAEHAAATPTIVAMAAAVSDYRPGQRRAAEDQEGGRAPRALELVRTPDILRGAGRRRRAGRFLVGFAAETDARAGERAAASGAEKNLDLIVANDVGARRARASPPSDNAAVLIDARGRDRAAARRASASWPSGSGTACVELRRGAPRPRRPRRSGALERLSAASCSRTSGSGRAYFATLTDAGRCRAARGRAAGRARAPAVAARRPPRRRRRSAAGEAGAVEPAGSPRRTSATASAASWPATRKTIVFGQGNPQRAPDVRGRGAGRRRGRAGPGLRGQGRPAPDEDHRGHRPAAASDVFIANVLKCRPPAEPQPGAGRDPELPAVPRAPDRRRSGPR